jgi:hypothetical protein
VSSRRNPLRKQPHAENPEYRERRRAYERSWYAAHKDEISARRRRNRAENPDYARKRGKYYDLKRRYGLSAEDYNALLARQGGVCAICGKQPSQTLCVDHNRKTRKVRRLLCRKCNLGIGHFDDDPRLLRAATDYLEAFEDDE